MVSLLLAFKPGMVVRLRFEAGCQRIQDLLSVELRRLKSSMQCCNCPKWQIPTALGITTNQCGRQCIFGTCRRVVAV